MASTSLPGSRLSGLDALRGLAMVVMALDHVRDFLHVGAMSFSPEDLGRTTPLLFLTRWITHFCAPVFALTAGMGAWLRLQRAGSKAELSRFLFSRGLWLVLLEVTVMRLALDYTLGGGLPFLLLVLWSLGASMIVLAALIHLPIRLLAVLSVGTLALHNCLDRFQPAPGSALATLFTVFERPGAFGLGGAIVVVGYPLLPWIAVVSGGYCLGAFLADPERRERRLLTLGAALTAAFFVLRGLNVYGDPSRWSPQGSATFTLLSFFRTTKYPPSLLFLLMTLGPALLALAWLERRRFGAAHPLVVFGRVPLFYYVGHFWAAHLLATLLAWLRYGAAASAFAWQPLPSMGGPRELFPPDFGYPLWAVYVAWAGVVLAFYPLCRWYAGVKARRTDWWLSYL